MILREKFLNKIRWLFGCLFIFITGCKNCHPTHSLQYPKTDSVEIKIKIKNAFASIEKITSLVNTGDMILRTGNDFTSESLQQMSFTDKTYSHCGIASIENDSVFVYHALGGEWNPDEKLRRDPFELFCNPIENRGFGIFSFKLNPLEIKKLDSIVKALYSKSISFDMKFDLATNDKMYCSEFVSKAISSCTNNQIVFTPSNINSFKYIAIDNLILNPFCFEKKRIKF